MRYNATTPISRMDFTFLGEVNPNPVPGITLSNRGVISGQLPSAAGRYTRRLKATTSRDEVSYSNEFTIFAARLEGNWTVNKNYGDRITANDITNQIIIVLDAGATSSDFTSYRKIVVQDD